MSLTESFKIALENEDITKIRAAITNSFTADPSLNYFEELMDAVDKKGIDIFEPHNEKELKYNQGDWTKEYFTKELTEILFNFSKERLDLLKNITKKLYPNIQEETFGQGGHKGDPSDLISVYHTGRGSSNSDNNGRANSFVKQVINQIDLTRKTILKIMSKCHLSDNIGDLLIDMGSQLRGVGQLIKERNKNRRR